MLLIRTYEARRLGLQQLNRFTCKVSRLLCRTSFRYGVYEHYEQFI